jgi:hypothetical protein
MVVPTQIATDMTPKQALTRLKSIEPGRGNPRLYEYLRWKYEGEPIFERDGFIFPVTAYPASRSQQSDPESALIRPISEGFPTDNELLKAPLMRELVQRAGKPAQNLPTFAMQELLVGARVQMRCQMGRYFDMIDTCDALEWEILRAASSLKTSSTQAYKLFDKRLPLRSRLHAQVSNPVRSGACRSLAISLNALVAFYQDDGVYLMLRKRSEQVAVHAGLIHVIPSFMFQPATPAIGHEFSLRHNIYREYLEELFDRPDPQQGESDPDYFAHDPLLIELSHMLETGRAEWYYTGVAVNLLNLRPDICTVLLIKDDLWYRRHADPTVSENQRFQLNVEFAPRFQDVRSPAAFVGNIPLKATDREMTEHVTIEPRTMTPCGAFAFWAGVDLLRTLPEVQTRIA